MKSATSTQISAPAPAPDVRTIGRRWSRWRPAEIAFWVVALGACVVPNENYLLLNEMAILALFAVSLDLILGYTGIVSLGHAAFFGLGAYTAALLAKHFNMDPLSGMLISCGVATFAGLVTSMLVMRGSDLTRLMVTLGVASILHELANRMGWLTGGADGLTGVPMVPLFGHVEFDIFGKVAYSYSIVTLFVLFLLARAVVKSPFGMSLQVIRQNPLRAAAMGVPVNLRRTAVYTLSAAYAGVAGALLAQTTGFASLDVLDFHRSADVLLMLMIGGAGYLYGGIMGAVIFRFMQNWLADITPQYWQFWIGLLLVIIVIVGHERLVRPWTWFRRSGGQA
ncbi:branched-chain amino acid ABC transporter permease [Paraburkholderia sp. MMS20-SJTR3]|uniref:Branched-chain amino acid ABC transporter permease n=1 Tax=Paraburkholderia sejongensis TaxID=2886946 RepID=A0ABS8K665_9BURK|nr:branched-chain amino acid ABC transporter permease [Paraburkholderia sp. MMS20-SJTR3]MCC8397669.1 branched-chain amino acid ABC transporter permease [Paraburkholderia sp. MMS20-SJTR3]